MQNLFIICAGQPEFSQNVIIINAVSAHLILGNVTTTKSASRCVDIKIQQGIFLACTGHLLSSL